MLTWMLRWYPAYFRARFEPEMLAIIDETFASPMTPPKRAVCVAREAGGLAAGIAREWMTKLTADPIERARTLPDCRLMRPVGITRAEWAAGLKHVRVHPVNR